MRSKPWLLSAWACVWISACLIDIKELHTGASGGGGGTQTGGQAGSASTGGGGGVAPCPDDMVHAFDATLDVSFCIDRYEVTQTDYVAFLTSVQGSVPVAQQPAACSGNTDLTYTPDGSCPDFTTGSSDPVYCVDWCDAHAYCDWAGKRLCRKLAGGPLGFDDPPNLGEWHFACSGGLKTAYPYGDQPETGTCNVTGMNTKMPVGSYPMCEGGLPGLFDMQGNVAEWIDACQPASPTAECRARGGNTFGTATQWRCDDQWSETQLDPNNRETGIRCCRDAD